MPVQPTYPGVYIEELPSGVRTISGVATSITAFVGRARSGPVNEPVTIHNYGDYERVFGGLWGESSLGFAVRDFYRNGGGAAVVVRLFHPLYASSADQLKARAAANKVATAAGPAAGITSPPATATSVNTAVATAATDTAFVTPAEKNAANEVAAAAATAAAVTNAAPADVVKAAVDAVGPASPVSHAKLAVSGLNLEAAAPGTWGNRLEAAVDHQVLPTGSSLFNLSVRVGSDGPVEIFRDLSIVAGHPRRVDSVVNGESGLVRVQTPLPTTKPAVTTAWAKVAAADQASDGGALEEKDLTGSVSGKQGIYALDKADLFNLLCIPPYTANGGVHVGAVTEAATYCEKRRAMLIVDPPPGWSSKAVAVSAVQGGLASAVGTSSKNAALFFPRLLQPNPERADQVEAFAPCGAVAGVFARTDAERGVWKAPAGLDAALVGVPALSVPLTDDENGELNPLGVNCLRVRPPKGAVIWGARTLQGDDRLASEWKYTPVRRLALYIEESLYRGTQWVVFEPNDEPLWSQIRLNVGAFMNTLFRQGAFQGTTPREAYLVKCDRQTTTQDDVNRGVVNILVGFAPLKPAEFVILRIQQLAGQIQT